MKKILLILPLLMTLVFNQLLAVRVDTTYIYTVPYNTDSSKFFLVAYTQVGSDPCNLQWINISDSVEPIVVNLCYVGGSATITCMTLDTIDLGVRKNGVVNIMAIFKEYVSGQCRGSLLYKDTFEFTINTGYSNIKPTELDKRFNIYLVSSDGLIICSTENLTASPIIQILSLTGQQLLPTQSITQPRFEVDVSSLPAGLYLAVLQNEKERVVRRWVKE